jgi:murein DD-endopeptidase MepM/ murein hydrolase activator NlpD
MSEYDLDAIDQELSRREAILQDMVVPVSGVMGGGYGDSRNGGNRLHKGGDITAPAGTPLLAPGNMEFVTGKQGGTNLRDNDWWSHWKDVDTGREYRFAHHGPVNEYQPGQRVSKGEQWGVVGDAIKGTHLHMAVYDPDQGKNIDWMSPLGLKRGINLEPGVPFAQAIGDAMDKRAGKIAATVGNNIKLSDIDAELASRGINIKDIDAELASRGVTSPQPTAPAPKIAAEPTPLYEMNPNIADAAAMKDAVLNPPNMGYRPGIARPILQALGMGLGSTTGLAAGGPLGAAAGGTLGYAGAEKAADALDVIMGDRTAPTMLQSLAKTGTQDIPAGAQMEMLGQSGAAALPKVIGALGTVGKAILGRLSGTGTKNVEEALKGSESFTKGLRGEISGEEIAQNTKDAAQRIRGLRSTKYVEQLNEIKLDDSKLNGIRDELHTTLSDLAQPDKFDIKLLRDNDYKLTPDFSNSVIVEGQNVVKKAIEDITNWPDNTVAGLDVLKKRLGKYISQVKSGTPAEAALSQLKGSLDGALKREVPGYAEMTKDYSEASSFIRDIDTGLMTRQEGMTGRITSDMRLRRLLSSMRDNFALRGELVDSLGSKAGEDLSGQIAGYNMRSILPHGLAGTGPVLTGEALLARYVNPKLWPLLAASSPRLQGESLRILGKGLRATEGMSGPIARTLAMQPFEKDSSDRDKFLKGLAE